MMNDQLNKRPIRSFVRREGRMTDKQRTSLERLWPKYGVDIVDIGEASLDFSKLFDNTNSVVLEIGFGMGHSLLEMAQADPGSNYLGIEVHRPGVGALLSAAESNDINNLRVVMHDAVEVLRNHIQDSSLDKVMILFPDPWSKKRHHKRRIIQPAFVELLHQKLKAGGYLHLATDWENYAEHMVEVMDASVGFVNIAGEDCYVDASEWRPATKFEQRGLRLGHTIRDLVYQKVS